MKIFLIILIILITCGLIPAEEQAEKTIYLSIDARMELLAIVQYLSGYGEKYSGIITTFNFPYKVAIDDYFKKVRNHRAVTMFASMSQTGFSFDAPPHVMLHLTDPPELAAHSQISGQLYLRAGGKEKLEQFLTALRDFAELTNFNDFIAGQSETYGKIIDMMQDTLNKAGSITTIEDYYGMSNSSYNIVMVPLFQAGGFGPRMERDDKTYDIYSICGPAGLEGDIPIFGSSTGIRYLTWHEFGHSFVNPLTAEYWSEIHQYSSLFNPIAEDMGSMAYGAWETCVNEHLVRAVTTRLSYIYDGEESGEKSLQREKARSFIYIDSLVTALERYENNRDIYADFRSFYPEIIEVFKNYSEMNLD